MTAAVVVGISFSWRIIYIYTEYEVCPSLICRRRDVLDFNRLRYIIITTPLLLLLRVLSSS